VTETSKYLNNLPGLLIFEAGKDQFCVDVKDVISVIDNEPNEYKIERTADNQLLLHYSDDEYFLFDSRLMTGNKVSSKMSGKKIVLCNLFGKRIGLIADRTIEFLSLDSLFVQKHVEFIEEKNTKFIKWRLEYQDRMFFYPDYEKIAKEFTSQSLYHQLLS
jgi:chemotaxis signal transduction protein